MSYSREVLVNWRAVLGATLGLAAGFSAANYVTTIMAPHMIAEFGWSRAEFASVGSLALLLMPFLPVVGRLSDVVGVHRTAIIGVVSMPLAYLALSAQSGDIKIYVALFIAQSVICITSTATVLTRIVVQYVIKARGLALAIVASGPAMTGILVAPLLNNYVEMHGWRQGYMVAATFAALLGGLALLILPRERKPSTVVPSTHRGRARDDYPLIFRTPAFWVMGGALLLCNLPMVIALTQLNMILVEKGATATQVSTLISAFAGGTLIGRVICGVALDRFAAQIVASIGMGMPCAGLLLLASSLHTPSVLFTSVLLIGLAFGAEGDLIAYLVARIFGIRIYGSVLGLMTAINSLSAALGALIVSVTLSLTGTYALFLNVCATTVFIGSLMFLLLKKPLQAEHAERLSQTV